MSNSREKNEGRVETMLRTEIVAIGSEFLSPSARQLLVLLTFVFINIITIIRSSLKSVT